MLANYRALDFGYAALPDTIRHPSGAGIRVVGADADVRRAPGRSWKPADCGSRC